MSVAGNTHRTLWHYLKYSDHVSAELAASAASRLPASCRPVVTSLVFTRSCRQIFPHLDGDI